MSSTWHFHIHATTHWILVLLMVWSFPKEFRIIVSSTKFHCLDQVNHHQSMTSSKNPSPIGKKTHDWRRQKKIVQLLYTNHDIFNWLVVWNMNFRISIQLGKLIPTDVHILSYFSEGFKPPTRLTNHLEKNEVMKISRYHLIYRNSQLMLHMCFIIFTWKITLWFRIIISQLIIIYHSHNSHHSHHFHFSTHKWCSSL